MPRRTDNRFVDLDTFYSQNEIDVWKKIIGDDLHYHFGYFDGETRPQEALRQTVRNFFKSIPHGARVFDAGCGWGAPARLLSSEHGCHVKGVTISTAQADYCRQAGLDVEQLDLEAATPDGHFDVALFLESIEHVQDKAGLLERLRDRCQRIIISSNAWAHTDPSWRPTFARSSATATPLELCALLEHSGFRVLSMQDRRPKSIGTLHYWKANFERVFGAAMPPGQLGVLRRYTDTITASPVTLERFIRNAPLVDIVADRV